MHDRRRLKADQPAGRREPSSASHRGPGGRLAAARLADAADANFPSRNIANLDESAADWVELLASPDGSFRVLNQRIGKWQTDAAHPRWATRGANSLQRRYGRHPAGSRAEPKEARRQGHQMNRQLGSLRFAAAPAQAHAWVASTALHSVCQKNQTGPRCRLRSHCRRVKRI